MNKFLYVVIFFILSINTAQAASIELLIINKTPISVIRLEATRAGYPSWGSDHLGVLEVIRSGTSWRLIMPYNGHCNYDIRATLTGGHKIEGINVDLCDADTWTLVYN